jgi:hypothetical protein
MKRFVRWLGATGLLYQGALIMTHRDGFPPTRRIAHAISMGHYRRSLVLLAAVAILAGCIKTDADEAMVEFLEGNANEATFLVGVNADPKRHAKAHCALYGRVAVLRDVDTAGDSWEAYTTGSRPYIYYFDCL